LAAAETREWEPTAGETEKAERYEVGDIVERIPGFWPERKWDRDTGKMSEEQTKRLAEAMSGPAGEVIVKVPRVRPCSTGVQKIKRTSLVLLDFQDYGTDGSDGDTDWDDF
jgi:hypothetical protein